MSACASGVLLTAIDMLVLFCLVWFGGERVFAGKEMFVRRIMQRRWNRNRKLQMREMVG